MRRLAFKIVHSSTKLLPRWKQIVEDLKLSPRIMPRDVRTHWNSTFLMLDFALEYREALDKISSDRDLGLRAFELSKKEWEYGEQLRDVLEASTSHTCHICHTTAD